MNGQTRKCPICERPYKVFLHTIADQSACPVCVAEAERRVARPTRDEESRYLGRMRRFYD